MMIRYPRPKILASIPTEGHGVIEASAGTGKTYTIEHLVVDLIVRTKASLENILVVTFTDKATKELKARIRQLIETVLACSTTHDAAGDESAEELDRIYPEYWHIDDERRVKLESQLFAFDLAPIHTIHGFCRRVLMEMAFDARQPIEQTKIDGQMAFNAAFEHTLKTDFLMNSEAQTLIRDWLATGQTIDELKALLLGAHRSQYLAHREGLDAVEIALVARLATGIQDDSIIDAISRLAVRPSAIGQAAIVLNELRELYRLHDNHPTLAQISALRLQALTDVPQVYTDNPSLRFPEGLDPFTQTWLRDLKSVSKICHLLYSKDQRYVDRFLPAVVRQLSQTKKREGLFEFDDLLTRVSALLQGPQQARLLDILRGRFDFALIDEFQDTDARQWFIFKTVFVESLNGCLFVIGDPKQAIYGFRGADIHTYMNARDSLLALSNDGCGPIALQTNFRSTQSVIEALNLFLRQDEQDSFLKGPIQYTHPVKCGRMTLALCDSQEKEIPPITCMVHRPKCGSRRKKMLSGWSLMEVYADAIIAQLKHLLGPKNEGPNTWLHEGSEKRAITAKDVFVLVRTKKEGDFIADALKANGFNCVLQQTTNIFKSEAAQAIWNLLRAIEKPDHEGRRMTAFSGPFFSADWDQLVEYRDSSRSHPFVQRLYQWRQLMEAGLFHRAFRSIQLDSGFVPRAQLSKNQEQLRIDIAHVFECLIEGIGMSRPSLHQLMSMLTSYMVGREEGPDGIGTTQRLAGVGEAIQILTIHKSKGLEAKCVFLFGGFLESWKAPVQSFKYHEETRVLIGTDACAAFRTELAEQARREDERLYYVGLTRAGAKLFLPFVQSESPIAGPYRVVNERLCTLARRDEMPNHLFETIDIDGPSSCVDPHQSRQASQSWRPSNTAVDDIFDAQKNLELTRLSERCRPFMMTSYSAMKSAENRLMVNADDSDRSPAFDQITSTNDDHFERLPGGRHVGRCLHEALELASLEDVAQMNEDQWLSCPETQGMFEAIMRRHRIDLAYRSRAQEIVYRALTQRFRFSDGITFPPLCSVNGQREVEFLFPLPEKTHALLGSQLSEYDAWKVERGLVKGFVDFVFEYENKIYWVDWKSDVLTSYSPESMAEHVVGHYDLQAALYSLSTCRMGSIRSEEDYENRFGGFAYIFLRGVHGGSDSCDGVYTHRPLWSDIVNFEFGLINQSRRSLGKRE